MHQQTWDNMTEDELAAMSEIHEELSVLYGVMYMFRLDGRQSSIAYGNTVVEVRELEGRLCDLATARLKRGVEAMKAGRGR